MTGLTALVVLSGGQDSTTCLFWAKRQFDEVHAVTFNYGQRHQLEVESAKMIAAAAEVASHEIINVADCLKSTSPLTSDSGLEQYEDPEQMEGVIGDRIELTFVPMRNALFFIIAANRAIALGCSDLVTGICQEDNANYPDCRDVFRIRMEGVITSALGLPNDAFKIWAPLMHFSKAQTVQMAHQWSDCWEALAYTHTGYDGKYPPTDMNHANVLRSKGFADANLPDPLVLRAWREHLMELPNTSNYNKHRT
ncbi:hypothetical protein LCGC14_1438920 [marine sediment metagenome]|uniref:7-cyano-7-deazaguanine synthase n=1 Tax=marine sediment metagenome TaxID=412755 RepID=A0A0F9K7G4_9ZZZZ